MPFLMIVRKIQNESVNYLKVGSKIWGKELIAEDKLSAADLI